jgi:predicted GNAT family acetyltransferase
MEILQKDDGKKGSFYIGNLNNLEAEMTYVWAGSDKLIIDHTEVSDHLAGQGIGKKLLAAVVQFARDKMVKIMPLCPFAKAVFDKEASYKDVLF